MPLGSLLMLSSIKEIKIAGLRFQVIRELLIEFDAPGITAVWIPATALSYMSAKALMKFSRYGGKYLVY